MNFSGYVKWRRGFLQHLLDGRINITEYTVHCILSQLADPSSGIGVTSARMLSANFDLSERQARRALEGLERKGYIKRFAVAGRHGNYPICIDKHEVTLGARTGMRLCAEKTRNWRKPVYLNGPARGGEAVEHVVKQTVKHAVKHVSSKERIETREGRKKELSSAFAHFWKDYPRKDAKARAEKAWRKIKPEEYEPVLKGLAYWRQKWAREKREEKHIPLPATWLNSRDWADPESQVKCLRCQDTGRVTSVDGVGGYCYECEARHKA